MRKGLNKPDWNRPSPDAPKSARGLSFSRYFTHEGVDPYTSVAWKTQDVVIDGSKFVMKNVVMPETFSDTAAKVVASRYLRQRNDAEGRPSVRVLIEQVVDTFLKWGDREGYFASIRDAMIFADELAYILLHQIAAFNSPVWFNFGIEGVRQQGSACFINPAVDTMEGWIDLVRRESLIFKGGSGAGMNISPIRSSWEKLSGGGEASGPISLMETLDTNAKQIKSGGRTRRAAKMVILDVEHPDILWRKDGTPGFAGCKADAEKLAHLLIDLGFDPAFNVHGGAYDRVPFQNANHSINAPDAFMHAVRDDREWHLKAVTTGEILQTVRAREIWAAANEAAWFCGDPGWQFRDTINAWNTCSNSFTIKGSNPCSEYVWDTDTSCNLASIRLTKFLRPVYSSEGRLLSQGFDLDGYLHTVQVLITAMEIQVGCADYPTAEIDEKTKRYRTLGLGPADLGAFLMKLALPYDSEEGRGVAAMLQSVMTAAAYRQSAEISEKCGGPFAEFEKNRTPMLDLMIKHQRQHAHVESHAAGISLAHPIAKLLYERGDLLWTAAWSAGHEHGFRNAQTTLAAPTGTISFLMDCDTTGIEPDIALKKFKTLVGGGYMEYVNQAVRETLELMGYQKVTVMHVMQAVEEQGHLEGCAYLNANDLAVFDCAFAATHTGGTRVIAPEGHVRMLGALQPFFSMAISKTVNCPSHFTPDDMGRIYFMAWELGVKCVALYRDGCKKSQPLATSPAGQSGKSFTLAADIPPVEAMEQADALTYKSLIELLMNHCGERGDSEGAVDTLARILAEREALESIIPEQPQIKEVTVERPRREKLPDERRAVTHKFEIGGIEGYATVGMYPDGRPGELFVTISKQGSTISGLLDSFATAISLGLQYGVPLAIFIDKFKHARFEPAGFTPNPKIKIAKSIVDYLFRWMDDRFGAGATKPAEETPALARVDEAAFRRALEPAEEPVPEFDLMSATTWPAPELPRALAVSTFGRDLSGPACGECGGITQPSGKCYVCSACGATTGCS